MTLSYDHVAHQFFAWKPVFFFQLGVPNEVGFQNENANAAADQKASHYLVYWQDKRQAPECAESMQQKTRRHTIACGLSAIPRLGHLGMISLINHDSRVRENSEVVIICPDSSMMNPWYSHIFPMLAYIPYTWILWVVIPTPQILSKMSTSIFSTPHNQPSGLSRRSRVLALRPARGFVPPLCWRYLSLPAML